MNLFKWPWKRASQNRAPANDVERMLCAGCGAWQDFSRGRIARSSVEGYDSGSPEEAERLRIALPIDRFIDRHVAHWKGAGDAILILRPGDPRFDAVDIAKREA